MTAAGRRRGGSNCGASRRTGKLGGERRGRRNWVQEDTGGTGGAHEDTTYAVIGTVRPRVQISGPRPSTAVPAQVPVRNGLPQGGPNSESLTPRGHTRPL